MKGTSIPSLPSLPSIPRLSPLGIAEGFNPADFAPAGGSLFLDLNPDEFTTADGQLISSETDSVAGIVFTSSGAARPTMRDNAWEGHAAIDFSVGNYLQSTVFGAAVSQPWTAVILARKDESTADFVVLADGIANTPLLMFNNNLVSASANFVAGVTGLLQKYYHCFVYVYNGASSKVYMNGREVASGNFTTVALDGLTLGAANNLTSALLDGRILRAIIYSGAMSAAEVVTLNDAIREEYHLNGGYTRVDTTIGGQNVRFMVPDKRVAGTALVYCHGLGENSTSISDSPSSDKILFTLDSLGNGYMIAAGNLGGDTWSNSTAETHVDAIAASLVSTYAVTTAATWSQSAGGPLGLLKAVENFTGIDVKAWFGIYPVYDLDAARANAALTASINAAFPSYPTDAVGRDPALFAAADYAGLRLRCCQGAGDTITPKAVHGDALVTKATGQAIEVTCIGTAGDHGDASNFTQTRSDDFISFLGRCFS